MREILFRGKSVDNGEWVYGYLVCDTVCYGRPDHHSYIVDHAHPSGCFGRDIYTEIDASTVGQYIGLKDKNGRRIFEGDIVTGYFADEKINGVIQYGSDAQFYIDRSDLYGIFLNNAEDWVEIIGNIHDDPEFLEGENDAGGYTDQDVFASAT